jgi:hypothetical protein
MNATRSMSVSLNGLRFMCCFIYLPYINLSIFNHLIVTILYVNKP